MENIRQEALEQRVGECGQVQLRERLDTGHGKKVKLTVRYSEANDEYMWEVEAKGMSLLGFEPSFELAVDTACQVYADYRNGGWDDEDA